MAIEKIRPRIVDATGNYTFNDVTLTGNVSAPTSIISNVTGVTNLVASSTTINVTGVLSVASNVSAGNIKTNNLLYANGVSWEFNAAATTPGGSNTQVQFNDTNSFGASPNFTFNKSTNTLLVTNISANGAQLSSLTASNISGQVANALVAETIYANAQPNITSVGTLTSLTITGNLISGNASLGNATSSNYFIGNGSLLSSISGGNVTGQVGYAAVANSVSGSNVVGQVTFAATANAVAGSNVMGTVSQATYATTANSIAGSNVSGNVTSAVQSHYANIANSVAGANVSGNVTSAVQSHYANIANSVTGSNVSGNVTSAVQSHYANIANSIAGSNVSGNVTSAVQSHYANIANSVAGANVSGQVTYAATANSVAGANVSGTVSSATTAGTVTTASQPNITSVGTLTSLTISGNAIAGNADLGNTVTANYFVGSGIYVTGVSAVTAATITSNAQPNITSVGTLSNLVVGNATANTTFGNGTITASGNISFTGANVSLGSISNLKISGGTAGYFISTDGAGNLSWGAAAGGGGVSATGSNTQIQFNDGGVLGASANLVFDKTTNTFTTGRIVTSAGANLGTNVSNVYIGGGGASQILATDGAGNLTWVAQPVATITVDNFTGNGVQTQFTLSTTPTSINQTVVNYNGAFQLRTSAYTLSGPTITFTEAPANGSLIEVTTTMGSVSGSGAFVSRTYTGTGSQTNFTVTSGMTVSSVIVTENGLVQTPTTDYTISGTTLTFVTAPANNILIQIRELAIAIATTVSPAYRAYTGNGVQTNFTVTSGLTANSLIVAENGIIQRPTTDYTVSGSTVTFVTAPANGVDIQIRELSLNGGMSTGGTSLPYQGGNSGKYLTTDGATASWSTVSALPTQTGNSGKYLTTDGTTSSWATVSSGLTAGKTIALNMFLGF